MPHAQYFAASRGPSVNNVAMRWHGAVRQAMTERSASGVIQGLKKMANMGQRELKDFQ